MKLVRSTIGYMFAGMIVMSVWGGVIEGLGTIGGILAGFLIIGVMWFLNHHLGLVYHGPQSGFVDLGMGVGFTGIFRDMWISILGDGNINALTDSLPTIAFVVIGALIGGYLAAMVERDLNKDAEVNG
ncbi:MAG TPA: hypothetical protein GX703_03225 [Erysipelothrix sp.]|nr:hypothetical protein [Erysipelothrix sp.]